MDKRIYISIAIVLVLSSLGLLAYNIFEIRPHRKMNYPSWEVSNNNFYALEQWLKQTDRTIRYLNHLSPSKINDISEKVIITNSWAVDWDDTKNLLPWIEQGGYLVIHMDRHRLNKDVTNFLSGLGITLIKNSGTEAGPDTKVIYPDHDKLISFKLIETNNTYTVKDNMSFIRLAEVPVGNGAVVVTGRPFFMYNNNIGEEVNAHLSWKITGAQTEENDGILFIRSVRDNVHARAFFGTILRRGNVIPIVVSAVILIFVGFWSVIPLFGLVTAEKQRNSRPIRDRFIAEIYFLKKTQTLDYYLDVYEREHKIETNTENKKRYRYKELIKQYRRIFDETAKF